VKIQVKFGPRAGKSRASAHVTLIKFKTRLPTPLGRFTEKEGTHRTSPKRKRNCQRLREKTQNVIQKLSKEGTAGPRICGERKLARIVSQSRKIDRSGKGGQRKDPGRTKKEPEIDRKGETSGEKNLRKER